MTKVKIGVWCGVLLLGVLLLLGLWWALDFSGGQRAVPSTAEVFAALPTADGQYAMALWQKCRDSVGIGEPSASPGKIPTDETLCQSLTQEERSRWTPVLQTLRRKWTQQVQQTSEVQIQAKTWESFLQGWEKYCLQQKEEDRLVSGLWLAQEALCQLRQQQTEAEQRQTELLREIDRTREQIGLRQIAGGFGWSSWSVVAGYLILTTILGALLAGKQATMRDFFLGGRKLPWYAVCGSIMATEVSAATFLIAPALVYAPAGNMTYLQLAIGTILARFLIGYFFVPAFYQREIYSPYEYMGHQLGPSVQTLTTLLFMLGAILGQGARIYIAAYALQVITGTNWAFSVILIGIISMVWTFIGGIKTVIWTDAIQAVLFFGGAIAALLYVLCSLDGGLLTVWQESVYAGKLKVYNPHFNFHEAYTLWCGLFATGFLTLASHGTDQMMAQRIFTCQGIPQARKAIIWSCAVQILPVLLLFIGAALFVFYQHHSLTPAEAVVVQASSQKIFAVYIVGQLPPLLSGLLMACLFAAAISTLDSVLAALAQSTVSVFYQPYVGAQASESHYVWVSRVLIILWGCLMIGFALLCDSLQRAYSDLIQFALAMAAYTYGALLGTFLLAFLPTHRDGAGLFWGIPLSILSIFALNFHGTQAQWFVVGCVIVILWLALRKLHETPEKFAVVALFCALALLLSLAVVGLSRDGQAQYLQLAWPWHFPLGTAITFVVGYAVGHARNGTVAKGSPPATENSTP